MAGILLGSDTGNGTTTISNTFIDEYMANANGEYVKVYLYLLRCMNSSNESISISKMADKFDHTEKDIKRALKYWEKVNLLRLEFDADSHLTGIYLIDSSKPQKVSEKAKADNISLHREYKAKDSAKHQYTADEMKLFQKDEAVQELFFVAENYFGHTLNSTEAGTILFWYDSLHFSADLIEYLIEHCSENGHKSVRYMDKVALSWKDSGITSVAAARDSVKSHSQLYYSVMKSFGISGRNLVSSESTLVTKWDKEYGFSCDIIEEACKRTMQSIHQPSFEYTDSILSSWHDKKISSLEEIKALDNAFQKSKAASGKPRTGSQPVNNKFNNFPQRTYNYDQLEKQLLNSSIQ